MNLHMLQDIVLTLIPPTTESKACMLLTVPSTKTHVQQDTIRQKHFYVCRLFEVLYWIYIRKQIHFTGDFTFEWIKTLIKTLIKHLYDFCFQIVYIPFSQIKLVMTWWEHTSLFVYHLQGPHQWLPIQKIQQQTLQITPLKTCKL